MSQCGRLIFSSEIDVETRWKPEDPLFFLIQGYSKLTSKSIELSSLKPIFDRNGRWTLKSGSKSGQNSKMKRFIVYFFSANFRFTIPNSNFFLFFFQMHLAANIPHERVVIQHHWSDGLSFGSKSTSKLSRETSRLISSWNLVIRITNSSQSTSKFHLRKCVINRSILDSKSMSNSQI